MWADLSAQNYSALDVVLNTISDRLQMVKKKIKKKTDSLMVHKLAETSSCKQTKLLCKAPTTLRGGYMKWKQIVNVKSVKKKKSCNPDKYKQAA